MHFQQLLLEIVSYNTIISQDIKICIALSPCLQGYLFTKKDTRDPGKRQGYLFTKKILVTQAKDKVTFLLKRYS